VDEDRDDTVIRASAATPAPAASAPDDADTVLHAVPDHAGPDHAGPDTADTVLRAARPAAPAPELPAELADTPRIDHATGLPVLPDLLVVPRAPDTAPLQVISYALRFAGELVPLDREVFVGRNPSPPRIPGGALPRLVSVSSPTSDVSRTHLAVKQLGASVVVTDLRSTNGSKVEVPGSSIRTLRGGESMVVSAGTRIDIGDGNVLEVHRLQPAGMAQARGGVAS
jgi:hypothetical protein